MKRPSPPKVNSLDSYLESRIREDPGFGRLFAKVTAELELELLVDRIDARMRTAGGSDEYLAGLGCAKRIVKRALKRVAKSVAEHE